ncbi:uncharacterized protein LOC131215778 [Anopheles bellator]|uniref:uncharacterized protein LOC131215778 n=1 Tax=Anopheles bellator TaxID=139047 RepID=UPI00264A487D|nr:uncharacterized protein LOC131215778 [Anopheles bellator]
MKQPTTTGRIVLGLELLLLVLVASAHARTVSLTAQDPTPNATNDSKDEPSGELPVDETKTDGSAGKSVVVNWKLTCEQLCSAGLGGPGCGATWLRPAATDTTTHPLPVDDDTVDGLCPVLCINGLGVSKCSCKGYKPKGHSSVDLICVAFCKTANLQLNGCSRCDGSDVEGHLGVADGIQTTTPNWDELCTQFCKMGDGGTLCNCDLPPFF